jgi:hypothetical protein
VKAAVGGKLGQIGGRMIDASARQLADQFFDALRQQLTPAQEPAAVLPATQNQVASVPAALALPPEPADPVAAPSAEVPRLLWFLLGVASTGFGVWLGKTLL